LSSVPLNAITVVPASMPLQRSQF